MAASSADCAEGVDGAELFCLFSWGANSYGQLGSGNREDTILPSPSTLPSSIVRKLRQIIGGGGHTALLTEDGEIHVCGWNKNGQLGLALPDVDTTTFSPLANLPCKMTKLSCGWNHTLALSEGGLVFAWGSNAFGQLGEPRAGQKQCNSPFQLSAEVFSHSKVCDIGAGLRHSLALTERGTVFSWGDGKKGQLGHGPEELSTQSSPKYVTGLDAVVRFKSVAVGAFHSTAVSEQSVVFAWGLNQHGQCGLGRLVDSTHDSCNVANSFKVSPSNNWITNVYRPTRVGGLPPVIEVHCGWSHTIAVTTGERRLFAWGRGDYGQLGRDIRKGEAGGPVCCHVPSEIPSLVNARQVSCGSEHAVVLVDGTDSVVTFGWNEHGICGTGNETNVHVPFRISKPLEDWNVDLIGTGAGHTLVVAKSKHNDSSDTCTLSTK